MNYSHKCLHKLAVENKTLDYEHDELTDQDHDCLYCCNGFNTNCHLYTTHGHLQEFEDLFDLGSQILNLRMVRI